jgi:hypothetical protein
MAPSTVVSPEYVILERTLTTLRTMAMEREFVRSGNEAVRSITANTVLRWRTLEGARHNNNDGVVNVPKPCLLVSMLPVRPVMEGGTNCAEDEVIIITIQIVDDTAGSRVSSGPYRTYIDWMNRIRHRIMETATLFRQDFDPAIADPYYVGAKDRVPSDPQKLWAHDQQVAVFAFFVKVRHHRNRT